MKPLGANGVNKVLLFEKGKPMKTLLILGCAAVATGAVAFTAFKVVTKKHSHAKHTGVPAPKADGLVARAVADTIIDRLHPNLAERFGSISDQRFGIERAPEEYHIQDGVINPEAVKKWEAEQIKEEGKKFKKLGKDQLATSTETSLITELKNNGFNFEVYTVGLRDKKVPDKGAAPDYPRVRGPVGNLDSYPGDAVLEEVVLAGDGVNKTDAPDALDSASKDGKVYFKAKTIRMNKTYCTKCHEGIKVGDKVGAIVYRYWQGGKAAVL